MMRTRPFAVLLLLVACSLLLPAVGHADGLQDDDDASPFPAWWADGHQRAFVMKGTDGSVAATIWHRLSVHDDGSVMLFTKFEQNAPGGVKVHSGTKITWNADGEPVRYELRTAQYVASIDLVDGTAQIHNPDGDRVVPNIDRRPWIANSDLMVLEKAIHSALAGNWKADATVTVNIRNPQNLATADFELRVVTFDDDGATLADNFREEITWSADGGVIGLVVADGALTFELIDSDFPDWPTGPARVMEYHLPEGASFTAQDVKVKRPHYDTERVESAGGFEIGGTINVPKADVHGEGPYPAVFLQSGSGMQNRHGFEQAMNIDLGTWEVLDAIAEAGFVVLRVDDRGRGQTPVGGENFDIADLTVQNLMGDARACVEYLAAREDVDADRIFVIGHSEGGIIAPMLANLPGVNLAGIVSMAGMGRNLIDVVYDQVAASDALRNLSPEDREAALQAQREITRAMREGRNPDPSLVPPGAADEAAKMEAWMASHFRQDVGQIFREVTCPVLIVQGDADFQVNHIKDARAIARHLANGACTDYTLRVFPDLDHLFKACGGRPSTLEMYREPRPVNPTFLDVLVDWLIDHARAD